MNERHEIMEKVEILEMTLEDLAQIEDYLISDFDDFWSVDTLKSELMGQNKVYIVAKQDEEIIGFAGYMKNFLEIEIMNIVVKKNCRGKGIGKMLLQKMLENAKNDGAQEIFLEVNENNKVARQLYQNTGFSEVGKRKNYYRQESAIVMLKKV